MHVYDTLFRDFDLNMSRFYFTFFNFSFHLLVFSQQVLFRILIEINTGLIFDRISESVLINCSYLMYFFKVQFSLCQAIFLMNLFIILLQEIIQFNLSAGYQSKLLLQHFDASQYNTFQLKMFIFYKALVPQLFRILQFEAKALFLAVDCIICTVCLR